jgi:hypothetical protein
VAQCGLVRLASTAQLHSDPKILRAFLSNERHRPQKQLRQKRNRFPHCFRDDKDVMMAVCAKYPEHFFQASPRLQDEDLFALQDKHAHYTVNPYVSKRVLKDVKMFFYAVRKGYCTQALLRTWLDRLRLERMNIRDQTELGNAISRDLRHFKPVQETDLAFPSKFSYELYDDESFMMPMVELHWYAFKFCSDHLRSNTNIIQAAVSQTH